MSENKVAEYIKRVIDGYLKEVGLQTSGALSKYLYRLTVHWLVNKRLELGRDYTPTEDEIKDHIKSIIEDIFKFHKDKNGYARKIAQNEYRRTRGLEYGSYSFKILDNGDEYKIIFYTSLCDDPETFHELAVYMPKLSEEEIESLEGIFS
ncbi:MAG: hypothetical protein ACXQS2_04340 [Methermicoccaceae archaeon]